MVDIVSYIPYGHENAIKRQRLAEVTGLTDREMRKAIELAQIRGEIIVNLQDGKGYFRPVLPEEENLVHKWSLAEEGRIKVAMIKMANARKVLSDVC